MVPCPKWQKIVSSWILRLILLLNRNFLRWKVRTHDWRPIWKPRLYSFSKSLVVHVQMSNTFFKDPTTPFGYRRSPHAILAGWRWLRAIVLSIYIFPSCLVPHPLVWISGFRPDGHLMVLIYIYVHIYARRLILTLCVNTKFDLLGLGSPKANEFICLTVPVSLGLLLQISHWPFWDSRAPGAVTDCPRLFPPCLTKRRVSDVSPLL